MQRLIAVVVVIALLLIGVGFYREWFAMSSSEADSASKKVNVKRSMNAV